MRRHFATAAALALSLGLLAACEKSTQEILDKAQNAETKSQLLDALGDPDRVNKLGPLETWSYKASNGEVTFVITGDRVTIQAAGTSKRD